MPLASKSACKRVGEDGDDSGRVAFGAALHETGDIAVPIDEDHFCFGPRGAHLDGVFLCHFLGCADQHWQCLRTCLLRGDECPVSAAIGRDLSTRNIVHRRETEQGECARVLEPGAAQSMYPGGLWACATEQLGVAVPPVVRLTRSCGDSEPCLPRSRFPLDSCASSRIEGATHGIDAVLLRQRETGKGGIGQLLILPELGNHTEFPVGGIEPVERLALLHHA